MYQCRSPTTGDSSSTATSTGLAFSSPANGSATSAGVPSSSRSSATGALADATTSSAGSFSCSFVASSLMAIGPA